jgi:hypothetical protein
MVVHNMCGYGVPSTLGGGAVIKEAVGMPVPRNLGHDLSRKIWEQRGRRRLDDFIEARKATSVLLQTRRGSASLSPGGRWDNVVV